MEMSCPLVFDEKIPVGFRTLKFSHFIFTPSPDIRPFRYAGAICVVPIGEIIASKLSFIIKGERRTLSRGRRAKICIKCRGGVGKIKWQNRGGERPALCANVALL